MGHPDEVIRELRMKAEVGRRPLGRRLTLPE